MSSRCRGTAVAALSFPILFLFQNCSQVNFAPTVDSASASQLSTQGSIRLLEPALAIRGFGCISCHANVSSNIISDFGYGGDGLSRDYFFGSMGNNWHKGIIYGDHHDSLSTLKLQQGRKFIVPKAILPVTAKGTNTLKAYVQNRQPEMTVRESDDVYIGAPTGDRLLQVFDWKASDGLVKYRKARATAVNLSGIGLANNGLYFQNTGTLNCEGDLLIKGTLHLENLKLKTRQGCRIYATESVFITGAITYLQDFTEDHSRQNLQISSARAINLGLGQTKSGGNFCESSGWYKDNGASSSLNTRFKDIWTLSTHFTREQKPPLQIGADVLADAAKIGNLKDASCLPGGRSVDFEHLLLSAPYIHSRYVGAFKGTIIAEVAIFSLSNFNFEYGEVFSMADTLPLLKDGEVLSVSPLLN